MEKDINYSLADSFFDIFGFKREIPLTSSEIEDICGYIDGLKSKEAKEEFKRMVRAFSFQTIENHCVPVNFEIGKLYRRINSKTS